MHFCGMTKWDPTKQNTVVQSCTPGGFAPLLSLVNTWWSFHLWCALVIWVCIFQCFTTLRNISDQTGMPGEVLEAAVNIHIVTPKPNDTTICALPMQKCVFVECCFRTSGVFGNIGMNFWC